MKRIILSLALLLAFSITTWSQVDVYFRINHLLGSAKFTPNHTATNNLGNNFNVQRLDYYISEITLIHDGGQQTAVTGHYMMVTAMEQSNDFLGSFNITNLEGIQFGIGVDPAVNHSDITTFPANHPLSFQNPSMHWGWAAGYRFIAIEGKTGSAMNLNWELHALGDGNYGYANVTTTGTMDGNDLIIALDADYEMGLYNIPVSGSLNYHGENLHATTIMTNFKNQVFSEGAANIGVDENALEVLEVTPNPSSGRVSINLPVNYNQATITVQDLAGRLIAKHSIVSHSTLNLDIQKKGVYLVSLHENGMLLGSSKLVIQ